MATAVVKNLRDGVLTIRDSVGSHVTVTLDEGNLSYTEHKNTIPVMDRGVLDHLRAGDEQEMDVSFGMKFVELGGTASATSAYEALTQRGNASNWGSTRPEDVYTVSLDFETLNTSNARHELIQFMDFYFESIDLTEGDEFDVLTVAGKSFSTNPLISP